jgi:hypothetical protein
MSMPAAQNGAELPKARLVAVAKEGLLSRLSRDIEVTSEAVMRHMAKRLSFTDTGFHLDVFTDRDLEVQLAQMYSWS